MQQVEKVVKKTKNRVENMYREIVCSSFDFDDVLKTYLTSSVTSKM